MSVQTILFLRTVATGFVIGCVYDTFRVLRMAFRHPGFLIQLEDIVYWVLVIFAMFYYVLNINDGEVRVFLICGAALGMIIYFATLSLVFMKISVAIVRFVKRIAVTMIAIVVFPMKIFLRIMAVPFKAARRAGRSAARPVKKLLQNGGRYVKIKTGRFSKSIDIMLKKV